MTLAKRNTQAERARERREAEEEKKLRRKKLTPKEQEELEEKEFEEACERWIGKIIRVVSHVASNPRLAGPGPAHHSCACALRRDQVMLGSMLWGMLTSASEWAFRAPVLLERVDLAGRTIVLTGGTDGMGAAAARELARSGARVVLGARNLSKAEALGAALRAESAVTLT